MLETGGLKTRNRSTLLLRQCHMFEILALTAVLLSGTVYSADWTRSAGITVSTVFTDNVGLKENNQESDIIPTFAPYWSIRGKGGRVNFDMVGTSELKDVGGGNQANNFSYQAHADAELIERIFFIDADATAARNAIDPLSASGSDNLNETTNATQTYSTKISPYVKGRVKTFANFEARYTYNYVTSEEIDNGDTRSRDFSVSLDSGPKFGDVIWGIKASDRTTDSQSGNSTDKSSVNLNLGYQINRRWQVNGLVGREKTDFVSNGDNGGVNWEIGTIWTPSVRTTVDVGYGRRFSGPTGHLDLSHRSRRSLITASYSQEVTDSSELLSTQILFDNENYEGRYIDPFTRKYYTLDKNTNNYVPYSEALLINNITNNAQFLNDAFSMTYTLQGKRTTLSVNGRYTKNTAGDASETTGVGLGMTATRKITGLLSANAGLSLNRQETDAGSKSDLWNLNFGLSQKLGKKSYLNLNFAHAKRESDVAGDSYDENRVSLSLSHDFYQ